MGYCRRSWGRNKTTLFVRWTGCQVEILFEIIFSMFPEPDTLPECILLCTHILRCKLDPNPSMVSWTIFKFILFLGFSYERGMNSAYAEILIYLYMIICIAYMFVIAQYILYIDLACIIKRRFYFIKIGLHAFLGLENLQCNKHCKNVFIIST